MSRKEEQRRMISTLLANYTHKEKLNKSIQDMLYSFDHWKQARKVGLTISRGMEWNTTSIIKHAWKQKKQIALPKCNPTDFSMEFYKCTAFDQLENTYLDLYEPNPEITKGVSKEELDLIIVPGIAFDREGNRIGYGGGFFDRYLKGYQGLKIALAAKVQVLERIEAESHDIPIDYLITESAVIKCT
ncbi:5-formyltetrahydrofolate cyclo-ligase [Gracilibacillus dipsosauri]|uniref:5-formyltetrahydrofolate cyclo-ligase n=1 Tax=Gracilibacillus dipsosauri TaxID=178340 RepID=UPI00240A236E